MMTRKQKAEKAAAARNLFAAIALRQAMTGQPFETMLGLTEQKHAEAEAFSAPARRQS